MPSRKWLWAAALVIAVLALSNSGRYRLAVWAAAAKGGPSAPTFRSALVETAPYRYQPRVRRWLGPRVPQIALPLVMPAAAGESAEWPLAKTKILAETVWSADFLDIHYSRLEAGGSAHEVHQHEDEEILLLISGEAEIVGATPVARAQPGRLVYYASQAPHTIRAVGAEPATYVVWRWHGSDGGSDSALASGTFDLWMEQFMALPRAFAGESVKQPVFDGETRWLGRLYAHLRSLPPGQSIDAHEDDHDAILVLLHGTIETQGETLTAPAVSFNPAFAEHGMFNPGPGVAQYLAVDMTPR